MTPKIRFQRFAAAWTLFAFLGNGLSLPPAHAQELNLPAPGIRVALSPAFNPPVLKGLKVHPDNPFRFDFILDKGDSGMADQALKDESTKLIKYFLASLTVPEKDLWVNLSPYEKDRIVPESFGQTEMGRDLLAEDYMLKQITASLIYPEDEFGKRFWKRVYEEATKKYGTTNIPVNTFNKVWIVPEKAVVYENAQAGTAYVVESRLKVMLEQDYLALDKNTFTKAGVQDRNDVNALGSQIVREIVIPQLTKEVNENKNFAQLRQVFYSLILATWYKKKIKDSILNKVYSDRNKVSGINISDPQEKQKIYEQYLKAFKKGVYNYIKEEQDPVTQQVIPRKYFSGGVKWDMAMLQTTTDQAMLPQAALDHAAIVQTNLNPADRAMAAGNGTPKFYFDGLLGLDEKAIRKGIFGEWIDDWLRRHEKNGKKEEVADALAALLKDQEFLGILRDAATEDVPVEIIRFAVKNNFYLGTKSLAIFLRGLKTESKEVGLEKKIPVFSMPILSYVQLITALGNTGIQAYLESAAFKGTPASERLVGLLEKIREIGLPFDSDNLGQIYSALPQKLSPTVNKDDIQLVQLPKLVYDQLQKALADSRVQAYLESAAFKGTPASERLVGLLEKIREIGLPFDSDNLGHIYSALPQKLSPTVNKDDIQKVELPKLVYDQLQKALADSRVQAYLESAEFLNKPMRDRLAILINRIKSLGFNLKNSALFSIYPVLPDNVKGYVLWPGRNDKAMMVENTGGIDLNRVDKDLQVKNQNGGIKFHIDPAMLEQLQNAPGFEPVIISIQPMTDLHLFLGLKQEGNVQPSHI